MVVSYSKELSCIGSTTGFRLLIKWRGSIGKVIYRELIVYLLVYALLSLIYRLVLDTPGQKAFESLALLCRKYTARIPVTFILGFYVSIVFTRWSNIINSLPWIDQAMTFLCFLSEKKGSKSLLYRRSITRYLTAAQVLSLRSVSMQVKKRFPTLQHIVDAGLLRDEEMSEVEKAASVDGDTKFWLPVLWSVNILNNARAEGLIPSDMLLSTCVQKVMDMRNQLGGILTYDWINIPMVYTQLVVITVWTYFTAHLVGQQWLPPHTDGDPDIDLYYPIFTTMEFICLVGWLNVALGMLNPLGENDDDIELNFFIDRNFKVGYLLADDLHGTYPVLKADAFAEEDAPPELPHTEASLPFAAQKMENSVADVEIPEKKQETVPMEEVHKLRAASSEMSVATSQTSQTTGTPGSRRRRMSKAVSSAVPGSVRRMSSAISRKMSGIKTSDSDTSLTTGRRNSESRRLSNGSVENGNRESADISPTRLETLDEAAEDKTRENKVSNSIKSSLNSGALILAPSTLKSHHNAAFLADFDDQPTRPPRKVSNPEITQPTSLVESLEVTRPKPPVVLPPVPSDATQTINPTVNIAVVPLESTQPFKPPVSSPVKTMESIQPTKPPVTLPAMPTTKPPSPPIKLPVIPPLVEYRRPDIASNFSFNQPHSPPVTLSVPSSPERIEAHLKAGLEPKRPPVSSQTGQITQTQSVTLSLHDEFCQTEPSPDYFDEGAKK